VQLFKILREIQRHRRLVIAVVCVSALIGFLLAFRPGFPPQSRQYHQAIASSDILIDTSSSQVVDVGGHGPDLSTLASRADLLGNLMVTGPLKESIAKTAGVSPENLVIVPPANAETPGVAPVPVETGDGARVPRSERSTLTFSTDATLPILHVVAEAPDAETAHNLALATVANLRQYLSSIAASQHIPPQRQLVARQFGAPSTKTVTRGVPHSLAFAVAVGLALLGCGAIIGGSWFAKRWREFNEEEADADRERDGATAGADVAHLDGSEKPDAEPATTGPRPEVEMPITLQGDLRRSG
jgi:hypothetical protein